MRDLYIPYPGHDQLVSTDFPYKPYVGQFSDYICVLYSGCDAEPGLKTVKIYNDLDYHVWYDTTPSSETVWTSETHRAISECSAAILLYSKKAFYSDYFWQCYRMLFLMKIPHMILCTEKEYTRSFDRRSEKVTWLERDSETFGLETTAGWLNRSMDREKSNCYRYEKDLGEIFYARDSRFLETVYTMNIRTRELWDSDRRPMQPVNTKQLYTLRDQYNHYFSLLPESFSADYREDEEDRCYTQEQVLLKREAQKKKEEEEARKKLEEEKKKEKDREYRRQHGGFYEGYPYMDEFEYIGSDKDDD